VAALETCCLLRMCNGLFSVPDSYSASRGWRLALADSVETGLEACYCITCYLFC
jgi:hypothetical protein